MSIECLTPRLDALGCVPMEIMPRNWRLSRVKRAIVALRLLGGSPKVTKGQGLQGVASCEPWPEPLARGRLYSRLITKVFGNRWILLFVASIRSDAGAPVHLFVD